MGILLFIYNYISYAIIVYYVYNLKDIECKCSYSLKKDIIYIWYIIAAIFSINQELYDSAKIDGASRWQQTIFITLPMIVPMIITVFILNLGFFLSMSGIITFPKSDVLRDIFALAPIDRILVETDSPYLAPPPYRGKRNEPAYVAITARKGAEIFDVSYEDFAYQIEKNFERLFPKAKIYGSAA